MESLPIGVERIVHQIQYALAPAVMVSSSALLLLSFQNKFSSLANRFRSLKQEQRTLQQKKDKSDLERARAETLKIQLEHLMKRAVLVKNSILGVYTAIICFASTSVFIFLNALSLSVLFYLTIVVFILGMLLLLAASILMIQETNLFYKIISLEKES